MNYIESHMPDPGFGHDTHMPDPIYEFAKPLLEKLAKKVAEEEKWHNSKYEIVNKAKNTTKGTFGEEFTAEMIKDVFSIAADIIDGGIGDFDILTGINYNKKIEHKLACEDTNGKFQFNSLKKDADYDYAFCLGVSPNNFWFMIVSKDEVKNLTTSMNPGTTVYKLTGSKKPIRAGTKTVKSILPLTVENFKKEIAKIV
jgi:hypothetical protein